jgi:hypothetical protein
MTKRWVTWEAVSSLPQAKKISLDEQHRVNLEHMTRHDGVLIERLVVPGQSRSITLFEDACRQIAAYKRLYELIQARAFDVLVYLDRSRLGRKASLIMAVVELCQDAGIVCYETDSPPASLDASATHDGQIIGAIKSVGAQAEVERLVERHRKGMIGRVNAGKMPSNISWAWSVRYTPEGEKYLIVDDEPAAAIRLACDVYLSGRGLEAMAAALNDAGYMAPSGRPWTIGAVEPLLDKVWTYAGFAEVNRVSKTGRPYTRVKGNFPAIIDEQTALAVINEREARRNARRTANTPYLFSRVVECGQCNRIMIVSALGSPHHGPKGQRPIKFYPVVRCHSCHKQVAFSKVQRAIMAWAEALRSEEYRLDLVNAVDETALQSAYVEMAQLQKRLNEIAKAKERVTTIYVDGEITKVEMQQQRDRLQKEELTKFSRLQNLQGQVEGYRSKDQTAAILVSISDVIKDLFTTASAVDINAWLRQSLRIRFERDRKLSVLLA